MLKSDFTIKRLDPLHPDSCDDILSMAKAFLHTYSTDPSWQERYMCPACQIDYPTKNPPRACTNKDCKYPAPLVDYWTVSRILIDFYHEIRREDSVCFIAKDTKTGNVIGSCNGLFLTPEELTEELDLTNFFDLKASINEHFGKHPKIAYQSEIQVMPDFQKLGIAKKLFLARHHHFAELNPDGISIFRTLRGLKPATSFNWMIKGPMQYKIIAEYCKTKHPDQRDRVIAAQKIKTVISHYADLK